MKSFLIVSLFMFVIADVFGAPELTEEAILKKQEAAKKECNEKFPVSEDLRQKLGLAVLEGEILEVGNSSQWCNLYCYLEKVGFFDSNGEMRGQPIFKYALVATPALAPNAHTLSAQLFMIKRSTLGVQDKCKKAFLCYYELLKSILTDLTAIEINHQTNIRNIAMESLSDQSVFTPELDQKSKQFLEEFHKGLIARI